MCHRAYSVLRSINARILLIRDIIRIYFRGRFQSPVLFTRRRARVYKGTASAKRLSIFARQPKRVRPFPTREFNGPTEPSHRLCVCNVCILVIIMSLERAVRAKVSPRVCFEGGSRYAVRGSRGVVARSVRASSAVTVAGNCPFASKKIKKKPNRV